MNPTIHSSFLTQDESQLLIIDCVLYEAMSMDPVSENIDVLITSAKYLTIPVAYSLLLDDKYTQFVNGIKFGKIFYRQRLRAFCCSELKRRLVRFKRNKLILFGNNIETALCINALEALAEGYDVHIIIDACVSKNELTEQIAFRRLEQSGAISVTAIQVIGEWIESCGDFPALEKLRAVVPSKFEDIHQLLEIRLSS